MRVLLISVGRAKASPELTLYEDYAKRYNRAASKLGLKPIKPIEVDSGGGLAREGERLLAALPKNAKTFRLDEHGETVASAEFADRIARWRDNNVADLAFLIGGAEGFSDAVRRAVPARMAFGPQTWPHRLVRVMLAEQLYRASSILAGNPYHKT